MKPAVPTRRLPPAPGMVALLALPMLHIVRTLTATHCHTVSYVHLPKYQQRWTVNGRGGKDSKKETAMHTHAKRERTRPRERERGGLYAPLHGTVESIMYTNDTTLVPGWMAPAEPAERYGAPARQSSTDSFSTGRDGTGSNFFGVVPMDSQTLNSTEGLWEDEDPQDTYMNLGLERFNFPEVGAARQAHAKHTSTCTHTHTRTHLSRLGNADSCSRGCSRDCLSFPTPPMLLVWRTHDIVR